MQFAAEVEHQPRVVSVVPEACAARLPEQAFADLSALGREQAVGVLDARADAAGAAGLVRRDLPDEADGIDVRADTRVGRLARAEGRDGETDGEKTDNELDHGRFPLLVQTGRIRPCREGELS